MGSAEESALFATVGACMPSEQVCGRRGLVRRVSAFCVTKTVLERCRKTRAVLETRAGYRVRVYCTGLLCTGLLSYVSRK
jgi:hypothetical protein